MISHVLFSTNEVITNNYSETHQAIDVVGAGNSISDVIAYENGTVILVVDNVKSNNTNTTGTATYGNFIKIKHGNNIQTLYAHLKYGSVKVKKGDYVKKGQAIGTMGNTGRAFGIHLHFEVMDYNNKRKNPYDYLWKTNNSPVLMSTNTNEKTNTVENNEEVNNSFSEENNEITEETNENEENNTLEIPNEPINNEEINKDFTLFENSEYKYMSLSDALNEIYVNNNYDYREKLALKNGITNYTGSKTQNLKLLQLLRDGNLKAVY